MVASQAGGLVQGPLEPGYTCSWTLRRELGPTSLIIPQSQEFGNLESPNGEEGGSVPQRKDMETRGFLLRICIGQKCHEKSLS